MRKGFLFGAVALLLCACSKVEAPEVVSQTSIDPTSLVSEDDIPAPSGDLTVVYAGYTEEAGTRSRIEMTADGSLAQVLWTGGDSFLCRYNNGSTYYSATFKTEDDGVSVAAFSTNSTLNGSGFHCFYPKNTKQNSYNGERVFGMQVPATQNAKAGGIEEGLNLAYAYADQLTKTLDEPLSFHNLLSLIKFRMDGAVVSQVSEITFYGTGTIAGDKVFHQVNGMLEEMGLSFSGDTKYSKVVLKGEFQADTDYYIALWPSQMTGFRMEFSDGNGGSTLKQSTKKVTFERSRVKDFGTIHLGDKFDAQDTGDYDPILYMSATEGTKPVTIAVIPEGFTAEEMPLYETLAKSGMDALFDTEPYKTYQKRFNVYILKVPSLESGASITDGNGNVTTTVATYFNARWGENSYTDMRADDTTVYGFVSEHCPDIINGIHTVVEVPILMIINDERYGGICHVVSNGKGYGMVPYTSKGGGLMWAFPNVVSSTVDPIDASAMHDNYHWTTQEEYAEMGRNNGDWRNTLVHEFGGHCFGRLGDEYWPSNKVTHVAGNVQGQNWPIPYSLNLASDPTAVPWQADLLDRQADLKARDPLYGRIGIFQGGDGYLYGRWRSEMISCMIDNRFYFSAWQRYLIAQRIFTLSGDSASFSFDSWLTKDVTVDPVRDAASGSAPGAQEHRTYRAVGPLPPPILVEE